MAKARWLKPEFFTDSRTSQLTDSAALVFQALWTEADDGGVVPGNPRVVFGRCFITRTGWTIEKVTDALDELVNLGLIQRGTYHDETWLLIPNLMKNQGMPPKKWRYLGETTHPKLVPQVFGDNPRQSEEIGENHKSRTLTPKPSLSYEAEGLAFIENLKTRIPEMGHIALEGLLRAARNPVALGAEINGMLDGMHGGATPEVMANALRDLAITGDRVTGAMLRGFVRKASNPKTGANGNGAAEYYEAPA